MREFPRLKLFSLPYPGQNSHRSPPERERHWVGSEYCHSSNPHAQNPAEVAKEPSDQMREQDLKVILCLLPRTAFSNTSPWFRLLPSPSASPGKRQVHRPRYPSKFHPLEKYKKPDMGF